ncbi:nuclear transport factor 2 family protein [Actinoplanes sp. CA-131856]
MSETLPDVITGFLTAHQARETAAAAGAFAPDAVVVDDGHTYRGADEIRAFLTKAGSQYTYTTEIKGATVVYDVLHRLEGDFPGGVVDLHYLFELRDGAITRLEIRP